MLAMVFMGLGGVVGCGKQTSTPEESEPRVEIGPCRELTREPFIDQALRARVPAIRACLREAWKDPSAPRHGTLMARISLTNDEVSASEVTGLGHAGMEQCMATALRRMVLETDEPWNQTPFLCPMAFGTMPAEDLTEIVVFPDVVLVNGTIIGTTWDIAATPTYARDSSALFEALHERAYRNDAIAHEDLEFFSAARFLADDSLSFQVLLPIVKIANTAGFTHLYTSFSASIAVPVVPQWMQHRTHWPPRESTSRRPHPEAFTRAPRVEPGQLLPGQHASERGGWPAEPRGNFRAAPLTVFVSENEIWLETRGRDHTESRHLPRKQDALPANLGAELASIRESFNSERQPKIRISANPKIPYATLRAVIKLAGEAKLAPWTFEDPEYSLDYRPAQAGQLSSTSRTRGPGPHTFIKLGTPEVDGERDANIVRRYLWQRFPRMTHCYEKVLRVRPGLAGTVMLDFQVDGQGKVLNATASGMDDAVAGCIAKVIEKMSFPAVPDRDVVRVRGSLELGEEE